MIAMMTDATKKKVAMTHLLQGRYEEGRRN
jgi:hypothetical protein